MYQDEVVNKEQALYIYNGLLKGDDFFGDIQCFFPNKSDLIYVKKGQRVTVVGYCDGLFLNVLLKNCIVK